jgi:hypothetical protein
VASTGVEDATCFTEFRYLTNTQTKNYACLLTDGFLSSIIIPDSVSVACSTRTAAGTTPSCEVNFLVKDPQVKLECLTSECGIKVDSQESIYCAEATCSCPDDETCGDNGE